jgi:hypothetical protein
MLVPERNKNLPRIVRSPRRADTPIRPDSYPDTRVSHAGEPGGAVSGEVQMSSGTILIAPEGHSATHMPQPLQ